MRGPRAWPVLLVAALLLILGGVDLVGEDENLAAFILWAVGFVVLGAWLGLWSRGDRDE